MAVLGDEHRIAVAADWMSQAGTRGEPIPIGKPVVRTMVGAIGHWGEELAALVSSEFPGEAVTGLSYDQLVDPCLLTLAERRTDLALGEN